MCHLPSSYVFVEVVGIVMGSVLSGGGGRTAVEMLVAAAGPIVSGIFSSAECAGSEAQSGFAMGLEMVGTELEITIVGGVSVEVEKEVM